jgi:F-type H+-transporting ATPase subunit b
MRLRYQGLLVFALLLLPSMALAGGGGGHGFALKEHGFYVLNFIIFVGLLVFVARKPIGNMMKERSEGFARRLNEARAKHAETTANLEKARQKVELLDMETMALLQRLEAEGRKLQQNIEERAGVEEEKIRAGARTALDNEQSRLEKEFQAEVALESLKLAEDRIRTRWRGLPQERFLQSFVSDVNGLSGPGGE